MVSPLEEPPGTDGIEPFLEVSHALVAYEQASEFDIIHDHTGIGPAIGGVLDQAPPVVHTLHGPLDGCRPPLLLAAASARAPGGDQ
ncbi:MAG: hypothetical protein ACRDJ4_13935 [Actinomycetota bacterium]